MRSRSILYAVCLLGALSAAACSSDDDSVPATGGSSGKGNAGGSGKAGSGTGGSGTGGSSTGGTGGTTGGAAGAAGETGNGCTQLSDFVHAVIKDDTTDKSAPRPVNGVVFCDDPMDPAAYKDLF